MEINIWNNIRTKTVNYSVELVRLVCNKNMGRMEEKQKDGMRLTNTKTSANK